MYYYINSFYIYSLLGFFYEIIANYFLHKKYIPNILIEPIKPIYGVGTIITLIIYKVIYKLKINKKYKVILYVLSVVIILTTLEFISGHILHLIFNKSFWSYKKYPFHFGKYICLQVSIIWGIFALLYLFILKNKTDKIIKKTPQWFTNCLIIITIIDILISIIH